MTARVAVYRREQIMRWLIAGTITGHVRFQQTACSTMALVFIGGIPSMCDLDEHGVPVLSTHAQGALAEVMARRAA